MFRGFNHVPNAILDEQMNTQSTRVIGGTLTIHRHFRTSSHTLTMIWPQLLVITTLSVVITRQPPVGDCLSPAFQSGSPVNPPRHVYLVPITDRQQQQQQPAAYKANNNDPTNINTNNKNRHQATRRMDTNDQMPLKRMLYQQTKMMENVQDRLPSRAYSGDWRAPQWRIGQPARNSEVSEIVIEHMQTAASGGSDYNSDNSQQSGLREHEKSSSVIEARRYNTMNQQQLDSLLNGRRYKKTKSIQQVHSRLGQLSSTNASFEDINWMIAATCLRSHFGPQYIYNKDVKCASSQIVLTISRMQRAACKLCESYFHCEAFSNAMKNCRNNYDVQETIEVVKNCKDLFILGDDEENSQAADNGYLGGDCQKMYLCKKDCMYNPSDNTCPRNNCMSEKFGQLPRWQYMRPENRNSTYSDRDHEKLSATNLEEKGRALPKNSPIHAKEMQRLSDNQMARIKGKDQADTTANRYAKSNTNNNNSRSTNINNNNDIYLKTRSDQQVNGSTTTTRDRDSNLLRVNVGFPLI